MHNLAFFVLYGLGMHNFSHHSLNTLTVNIHRGWVFHGFNTAPFVEGYL